MANKVLPVTYLARHGETEWSRNGRHTGLTDLPLTEQGERNAQRLRERLTGLLFAKVLTSPLQPRRRSRARDQRKRSDFFERAFPASLRRSLARARTDHREISHVRHSKRERTELRT